MSITPMMKQWQECKEQAKGALLFFRLGDFYEAFHEDAEIIAKAISLTLTSRGGTPMCGVPFHTADTYIDKLIAKGFKVAIAEQTEDPKAVKGLVKREIVRIVTPGTIIHSGLISDKKNNFFISITKHHEIFGLAALDLTTAEFRVKEFEKQEQLIDEISRIRPSEILSSDEFLFLKELSHSFPFLVTLKPSLDLTLSTDILTAQFEVSHIDQLQLRAKRAATIAAGSLLLYLKEELTLNLDHIHELQNEAQNEMMSIDRSTMNGLEIHTSLIDLLDETSTPMGGRLLKNWVQYPLLNVEKIQARQKEVSIAIAKKQESQKAREILSKLRDIERLIMKVRAGYANPRDLYALGVSLSHVPAFKDALQIDLEDVSDAADEILNAMNQQPPLRMGEGEIFQDGYHPELDRLRVLSRDGVSWMANYQTRLREETGIKTLKVGYTKAFGYYIEISRGQSDKAPLSFHRKQTLTNAERFITEELKEFEHQVLTADERAKGIEAELFDFLRSSIATKASRITQVSKTIAKYDVYLSFAKIAQENGWVLPIVSDSDVLEIIQGRHPVIEAAIGRSAFIPNNTFLSEDTQMMLITGPNMAGKSTYIRQVALIVILAQIGSFVPAESAKIGLVDKIFSRIGASDDLASGKSTFMVEMSETANILQNASSKSLVLLDEIGRGTSTYDGISIAWAVAEYLLTTQKKQAKTLFATHYWELTKLENEFAHVKNYKTAIQDDASGIVFLRKIVKGASDKSYGIHVAKLAGLPTKAIKKAEEMLETLEKKQDSQLPLFTPESQEHPALFEIKNVNPDEMTPLMAHHFIYQLKKLTSV